MSALQAARLWVLQAHCAGGSTSVLCSIPGMFPGMPGVGGAGVGGGGSSGSALTIPAPVSADKPMPTAIAAALAARLRSVVFRSCLRLYAFNVLARG